MMPHSPNSWTRNWPGIEEPGIGYGSELKGILDSGLTMNGGHLNLHWPGFGPGGLGYSPVIQRESLDLYWGGGRAPNRFQNFFKF